MVGTKQFFQCRKFFTIYGLIVRVVLRFPGTWRVPAQSSINDYSFVLSLRLAPNSSNKVTDVPLYRAIVGMNVPWPRWQTVGVNASISHEL